MKKKRKWLRVAGSFLGGCGLLVLAFVGYENLLGFFALQHAAQQMSAEYEPFTLADLHLPAAPSAGAGPSSVSQAARELEEMAKTLPLAAQGPSGLQGESEPGLAFVRHREPDFPARLARLSAPSNGPKPVYSWSRVEEELIAAATPLTRLRQALQAPTAAPEVDYTKASPKLDAAPWKSGFWLLSAGLEAVHAGHLDAATDNFTALLALSAYLRKDFHPVGQMLALTNDGFTFALLWDALQADGWTDAQLVLCQTALWDTHVLNDAIRSFEVERVGVPLRFAEVRQSQPARELLFRMRGHNLVDELLGDDAAEPAEAKNVWLDSTLWRMAGSGQDEARALTRWQEFIRQARRLREDHSWSAFARRYPVEKGLPPSVPVWKGVLSELLDPQGARSLLEKIARSETSRQMTLAALALKRYQLRYGSLPASLDVLVPDFLSETPRDWMDGRPLRYQLRGAGTFLLYSVGTDGHDDGGDPARNPAKNQRREMWSGRDAVWPTPVFPK